MNCFAAKRKLSAYIDGELTGVESLQVRDHISNCSTCTEELSAIRSMKSMVSELPQASPPAGFELKILSAVDSRQVIPVPARPLSRWALALCAASAVAMAIYTNGHLTDSNVQAVEGQDAALEAKADEAFVAGMDHIGGQAPIIDVSYDPR